MITLDQLIAMLSKMKAQVGGECKVIVVDESGEMDLDERSIRCDVSEVVIDLTA